MFERSEALNRLILNTHEVCAEQRVYGMSCMARTQGSSNVPIDEGALPQRKSPRVFKLLEGSSPLLKLVRGHRHITPNTRQFSQAIDGVAWLSLRA